MTLNREPFSRLIGKPLPDDAVDVCPLLGVRLASLSASAARISSENFLACNAGCGRLRYVAKPFREPICNSLTDLGRKSLPDGAPLNASRCSGVSTTPAADPSPRLPKAAQDPVGKPLAHLGRVSTSRANLLGFVLAREGAADQPHRRNFGKTHGATPIPVR